MKILEELKDDIIIKNLNNMNKIDINIDLNNIKSKYEIFSIFSEKLGFPEYFWNNFDAFWDILSSKSYNFDWDITINILNLKKISEELKIFLDLVNELKDIKWYTIYIK